MVDDARASAEAMTPAGPAWSIPLAGGRTEVPASIDGVRALLTGKRLDAFDTAVADTPAKHLLYVVLDHALPADADVLDPATVARLRSGDFTGVLDHDGAPVIPRDLPPNEGELVPPVWTVDEYNGEPPTEFPATIAGIRRILTGDKLTEFEQETGRIAAQDLAIALFRWSYPAEQQTMDAAVFDRLAAQDHASCGASRTESGS
ncbi:hypothetical protein [Streptomyces sp. CAU 1734]|uniref:hypothetical protein n=1 Tax=Streptomyces sp. CAU 1734 TaxID=3140360 RepID=UPI003260B3C5